MSMHALPLTGERTVPGVAIENYWFERHVAAYRFAAHRCRGRRAVDAGCGEGYGTRLLADAGVDVVGVDLDRDVVAHATGAYPGVAFLHGDVCALPLPDASVDAVVSLQVVEHVATPEVLVAEAARVLRPGGELVIATPNRLTFSPVGGGSPGPAGTPRGAPANPFHVRELDADELRDLLAPRFRVSALLGLHHGLRLRAVESVARRPLPELVLAAPPETWSPWLRGVVARVRPSDFVLRADQVADSLDLVAVASRRDDQPPVGRAGR